MKNRFGSRFFVRSFATLLPLGAFAHVTYAQTTRTWDGGGVPGTSLDNPLNWSGDVVPTGAAPGDTAQWDGTVPGPLNLTYTAAGTGASLAAGNGIFLNLTSGQTDALTINEASGTAGLRMQSLTIASGAGPFTFGSSDATTDIITLGSGSVTAHAFTNNSANTATFGSDVRFAFGGGNGKAITFTGTGNWLFGSKFGSGGTGGVNSVTKTGTGTLTINNNIQGTNTGAALVNPGSVFVKTGAVVVDTNGVVTTSGFNSVGVNGSDIGSLTLKGTGSFISGGDFNVGDVGTSKGTLDVQDSASLTVGTGGGFFVGSANTAGSTASGIVNHNSGTVTVNRTNDGAFVFGGRNAAAGTGGSGTYNLGGTGALTNAGNAWIGGYGTGTLLQSGGTFNNSGWLSIARQAGSTGNYNLSSGQLTQAGAATGLIVGELGTGTLTVGESGTALVSGVLRIGGGATGNGTLNLNTGGTLTAPRVETTGGTSTFNFDGGTLIASSITPTFLQGLTTANVRNGGARIDTNGADLTIGQSLLHSSIVGDAAVDGGLVKSGFGTLTLTGASTYTGPTSVTDGGIVFSGSSSTGNISLTNSASLGAKVTSVNTSVVSSTSNPNLTIGAGGTSFAVDFNTLGNPTVPVFNLGTGVVTLNGPVDVSLSNTTALTSTPNNTTLTLLKYGSKTGAGTFNLTTPTAGHSTYTLNQTATALYLSVSANPVTWTGAASNAWNDNTLASPKNWKLPSNAATDFINGDTVLFTNTASNFSIDITEDVAPGSVTFSNTTNAYTLDSNGGFGITAGTVSLDGTGNVTINNINTYAGATTINAGSLTLVGSLTSSPVTLNAGTLRVNSGSALGTGQLTVNGGTIDSTVAGVVLFSGTPQAWNGDFTFSGTNDLDLGSGAVTLGGTGDRTVTVTGTLTVGEIKSGAAQGFIKQGPGTLVVSSDGANLDASVIKGVLNVAAGTLQINRPTGVTGDMVAAGVIGSGNIINGSASERWVYSNAATGDYTFSGTLSNGSTGALGFLKSGASLQTLSGANNFTGPINVNGGTLTITGTNASGGAVNVAGSAASPAYLNLQNSNALGTGVVTAVNRNSGIQLQGGITLPASVSFITSNDGIPGSTVPYAIGNLSGDNVINGNITLTSGGGSSIIQSDAGSLKLNGNITVAAAQSSRGIILQGASTGANSFNGVLSDLSPTAVASIIKNGTGTWSVTGANTYTGATTVNGGKLIISGNNAAATGPVTVAADATLAGNGNLGGSVTIAANGIQSVAVGATPGSQMTQVITGALNNTAGSILNLTAATAPAAGVYTLVTANGGISALPTTITGFTGGVVSISGNSLILTVSGSSGYDSWASANGLTGANNGATQDPDFDGLANSLEFVLGGNPLVSDSSKMPVLTTNATDFIFTFNRADESEAEIALTFQYGSDLSSWTDVPVDATSAGSVTVTENAASPDTVVVTIPKSNAIGGKLFGRLKAAK